MSLIIPFPLRAFIYAIFFSIIFSISWAIAQHNSQNPSSLEWENLTVELMPEYGQERYDVQALKNLPKKEYVVKSDLDELVDYTFTKGYLCNDEDKAMCMQKTDKLGDKTIKRLSVLVYFYLLGQTRYIYKMEFVDEKITLISPEQEVSHNLLSQKDMDKYAKIEKFLIKQTIIRDGEISLTTGLRIPFDGQPDFIFENTYIKTKYDTVIHAENNTSKVNEDARKMFKSYIEEMLEFVRNGYD